MAYLSRGISLFSFKFEISSIGSKLIDVTTTKILPMDSSFILLAMEVERIVVYSFSNQEVVTQFETIACSIVSWLVSKSYHGK